MTCIFSEKPRSIDGGVPWSEDATIKDWSCFLLDKSYCNVSISASLLLARRASKEILIMRARKDLAPELIELVRFIMREQDQRSQFQCELSIKLQNDKIILNF